MTKRTLLVIGQIKDVFNASRNKVSSLSVKVMQVCPRIKFVTKQLHDLHRVMNIRTLQPIPSHVQFRDEKAKSDFLKNFSRRGIHSERQVILSDFSNTDLPTVRVGNHYVVPRSRALP